MTSIGYFLFGLIGFILLVFFHELGHFLTAKSVGVGVEKFGIGMGPTIWKKEWRGTQYSLHWIPLGGFCSLKGQSDFINTEVLDNQDPDSFNVAKPWKKIWITFGGPLFSVLFGWTLLFFASHQEGVDKLKYTVIQPTVADSTNSFQVGDRILSVAGKPVKYWDDVESLMLDHIGDNISIQVERKGAIAPISIDFLVSLESPVFEIYNQSPLRIESIEPKSVAEKAQLQVGDIIYTINGQEVTHPDLVQKLLSSRPRQASIEMMVLRMKQNIEEIMKQKKDSFTQTLWAQFQKEHPQGDASFQGLYSTSAFLAWLQKSEYLETIKILFEPKGNKVGFSFYRLPNPFLGEFFLEKHTLNYRESLAYSFQTMTHFLWSNLKAFGKLLTGNKEVQSGIQGPVKIFALLGKSAMDQNMFVFLRILGLISLALALFNIMPFPVLDGGHILLSIIEWLYRKPLPKKFVIGYQMLGLSVLFILAIFVTIHDIIT